MCRKYFSNCLPEQCYNIPSRTDSQNGRHLSMFQVISFQNRDLVICYSPATSPRRLLKGRIKLFPPLKTLYLPPPLISSPPNFARGAHALENVIVRNRKAGLVQRAEQGLVAPSLLVHQEEPKNRISHLPRGRPRWSTAWDVHGLRTALMCVFPRREDSDRRTGVKVGLIRQYVSIGSYCYAGLSTGYDAGRKSKFRFWAMKIYSIHIYTMPAKRWMWTNLKVKCECRVS